MTANRSSSFDSVDRLLTGRKFFITDVSRLAVFSISVETALFVNSENNPVEKEAFARWAMV